MLAELHTVMVAWVASPTSSFNSMMDEARVAHCNATSIERRVVDVLVFGSDASCAQMHFYLDPVGISPQADYVIPLTITDKGCESDRENNGKTAAPTTSENRSNPVSALDRN